ncbi:hypothetical protein PENSPDRAFT_737018 [Peniophora sp. CONT]|nr:hypothetical protein PENSPDRAFT_737018 [Peniophora sp. CONT]
MPIQNLQLGFVNPDEDEGPDTRNYPLRGSAPRPKYVVFHPKDIPEIYPEKIFDHPDKFEPVKDWRGRIVFWGILPICPQGEEWAGFQHHGEFMRERKMFGNFYTGMPGFESPGTPKRIPEKQFTDVLVEKQIKKLRAMELGELVHRDYTLRISLEKVFDANGDYRIWRTFKVSGGISIAALADKILLPVMGWIRNYHAHAYTTFSNGATYGPAESKTVDMMHDQSVGWNIIPEKSNRGNWTLAHLLQKEGEQMWWLYDWGDRYTHLITVEEIAPVSESTGKFALLDGSGACPYEDGKGDIAWAKDIEKLKRPATRPAVLAEIRRSMNYKDKIIGNEFDPDQFDIEEARQRAHKALASPDSVLSGAKRWVYPMQEAAKYETPMDMTAPRKGQTLDRKWDEEGNRFMAEVTSEKRDKLNTGCCWTCGTPHDLSSCSRCHKPLYCGRDCQAIHWKGAHRKECKRWSK